jgi:pantoate--beta-alanine ligase
MITLREIVPLRARVAHWRATGERIGFVPTMGNLHKGHLQLVRRARRAAQRVVVSVFVNPMQFSPGEDFNSYPRTLEQDRAKLAGESVDLLFAPDIEAVYPHGSKETTRIEVPQVSRGLCADFRPGHFTGVATVVARLFNLVQPDVAIFGEKDFQQLAVIRRMVEDLGWPIEIAALPTVREPDGLAMSSRNQYLTARERQRAPLLYRTLCGVAARLRNGESCFTELESGAAQTLRSAGFEPDYVAIRNALTLEVPAGTGTPQVVLGAARLGKARLIDNVRV